MSKIGKITLKSGCELIRDDRLRSYKNPVFSDSSKQIPSGKQTPSRKEILKNEIIDDLYRDKDLIGGIVVVVHKKDGFTYTNWSSTISEMSLSQSMLLQELNSILEE